MNSGSERKLSMDELLEKNRPAQTAQITSALSVQSTPQPLTQEQTPTPEVHPTKEDWEDLQSDLYTLEYHTERQRTAGAVPDLDTGGRAAESAEASGADDRTGWKAEREFFFSAQNQTSQTASATHQYSGIDLSANGGGSTASALVGLGHRLEQLQPAAPVMPIQHYTDRKVLQKEREKKIALGHKADDHEDEVSYDWQQTM